MRADLVLKVMEAKPRDVGRSIARINNKIMERLGLVPGEIIEIKAKGIAYGITWPGYPDDHKDIIRMDGNTRTNAQVGLGEKVEIRKIKAKKAKKITVSPTQPIKILKCNELLKKILEGKPISNGQKIRLDVIGTPLTFIVKEVEPKGVVLITEETKILLKKKPIQAERSYITYEDIGGLKKEVALVREVIELPLRRPEIYQKLGIEPPKGVLLYGPPGCGKTLIVKAVANETDANFILISGPEIIGKYYGDSEKRLREAFEEAEQNQPSIIFIDEIDAIAPKRSEMTGDRMVERRVVSTLLTLMDGLKSRGNVMVIAATNQQNLLDPALRRGGRFDREIEIGIPDRDSRLEILQIHTRGMPLKNIDLNKLADITHGFTGADMALLCKEAAMCALRKILPNIDIDNIDQDAIEKLSICMNDFNQALNLIEPSALREVFTEIPKVHWRDIGGLEKAKQELIESIEWPLKHPELFNDFHTEPPKGLLLFGPPGTGKTLLAKAVATESGANFISIKGPELVSKFVGETERLIREMFRKARQASPCIIFFDEIDSIAPVRGFSFDSGVTQRCVSQILTEIDGIEDLKNVILIAATNRPDIIDPALLRPGRIDRLIYIAPPDEKERQKIFAIHLHGKPISKNVDIKELALSSEGYVGADIEAICREASMLAMREYIKNKMKEPKIEKRHFTRAMRKIKPSAIDSKKYEEFTNQIKGGGMII